METFKNIYENNCYLNITEANEDNSKQFDNKTLQKIVDVIVKLVVGGSTGKIKATDLEKITNAGTDPNKFKESIAQANESYLTEEQKDLLTEEILTEDEKAYKDIVDNYIVNIGRYFVELERDLVDLKFDGAKYPEADTLLKDIAKTLKNRKIKKVDTKADRIKHNIGKFVGGAITNTAIFGSINAILTSVGLNPYVVKAITGATTSILRDIRKGDTKDKKAMLKRALIAAGLSIALKSALDLLNTTLPTEVKEPVKDMVKNIQDHQVVKNKPNLNITKGKVYDF